MIKITGIREAIAEITRIIGAIKPILFTRELAALMRRYVHVATGYLKSTIYYDEEEAGASAWYAGYEVARGGEHDFVTQAIDALDVEKLVEGILK